MGPLVVSTGLWIFAARERLCAVKHLLSEGIFSSRTLLISWSCYVVPQDLFHFLAELCESKEFILQQLNIPGCDLVSWLERRVQEKTLTDAVSECLSICAYLPSVLRKASAFFFVCLFVRLKD